MRISTEAETTLTPRSDETPEPELSVVMPCLNEAQTIAICIRKAQDSFERIGISGEVVVADNGSTDGSQQIAEELMHASFRSSGAATAPRSRAGSPPHAAAG